MSVVTWSVVLGAALLAAALDARSRRIPNLLTFPLLAAGLTHAAVTAGSAGLLDSGLACVVLALPYVLLFVFAGGGAGDAKLMGALGAWLGLTWGLVLLAAVATAGTVLALVYARMRGQFGALALNMTGAAKGVAHALSGAGSTRDLAGALPPVEGSLKMPYGVAIFAGTCLAALGCLLWNT